MTAHGMNPGDHQRRPTYRSYQQQRRGQPPQQQPVPQHGFVSTYPRGPSGGSQDPAAHDSSSSSMPAVVAGQAQVGQGPLAPIQYPLAPYYWSTLDQGDYNWVPGPPVPQPTGRMSFTGVAGGSSRAAAASSAPFSRSSPAGGGGLMVAAAGSRYHALSPASSSTPHSTTSDESEAEELDLVDSEDEGARKKRRLCRFTGCTKLDKGRGHCKQHGGGKRCTVEGCVRSARGSSGLCIAHGGGPRCTVEGCNKSARTVGGFCKAHGGGRKCSKRGCNKTARGAGNMCFDHGPPEDYPAVASSSSSYPGACGGGFYAAPPPPSSSACVPPSSTPLPPGMPQHHSQQQQHPAAAPPLQGMMLECGAYLHTQQLGGMGRGHWQPPPHDYRHGPAQPQQQGRPLWRPAGRGGYPMLLKSDDDMAAATTGHHSASSSSSSSSRHRGYAGVSGGGGALPIWDLPVKAEGGSPPRGGLICSGSEVVSDADETQGPATQEPDQQGSDQEEGGRLDGETAIGDGDEDWIGQDVLEALQQGGGP